MSMFDNMLSSDETLFKNPVALEFDYIPKIIPFREKEQRRVAYCIRPLLNELNGRNIVITGRPGVGKTVACKHLLSELEDEPEKIVPIYINCWQKDTAYKIVVEMCDAVGFKFIQNKKTNELFDVVKKIINRKACVLVLDEIDKLKEHEFLYWFLEEIYKKSLVLITNYKEWFTNLDERIKSRLMVESIEFLPYNLSETKAILKQRVEVAFYPSAFGDEAFGLVAAKATELGDIRAGIYLLREAGNIAEDNSMKKISPEHAKMAIEKIGDFMVKKSDELEDETKLLLDIIKENSGKRIGELFDIYKEKGGSGVYKTFQRKIKNLEKNKFITVDTTQGGSEGNTSIIKFGTGSEKKLTEF